MIDITRFDGYRARECVEVARRDMQLELGVNMCLCGLDKQVHAASQYTSTHAMVD